MKKRFIVCVNNSTKEQDKKFIESIKKNRFGWWHYLNNTWLIVDMSGKFKASEIRDIVTESFDNEYSIVFQLNENEGTWSGFGPSSENRNMFKWIKEYWK